ncbi:hypothetical protein MA16_Dca022213 [Dendrobium catenatum]|uniref:Uncharacterized protein n=1 Tax=Dendrobium catenatum TaxID=906689 RepID=A0A2I0W7V1_9ASPA|nr:hypothetical protein MA16_Dca022213 [Dendrobium catenatum]
MHLKKNIFDNIFNTVIDIKDKSKDNIKTRMDLKEICRRFLKQKDPFTLNLEQRRSVCEWVKSLRVLDGYSSNLSRCVDVRTGRLFGMKCHDCNIFMQCLLPTAFSYLYDQILKPLIKLSIFFKDLCSSK